MTSILVAKQYIKNFYGKYEVYLLPLFKFMLTLICLLMINSKLGYMDKINDVTIVLILALMCSFMPKNFIIVISAVFILLHFYALSLECAIIAAALFLLMFLVYFRFSPKDTLVILLTPICFWLNIPYIVPIVMGLIGTPASAVSVTCGVTTYYLIAYVRSIATTLAGMGVEEISVKLRYIIDGMLDNKPMVVTVAAFAVTVILVYIIRRLSLDFSWKIAIVAGAVANVMILLIGDLMLDTQVSIGGVIVGTIVSALLAFVIEFFKFNVDYSRTEKVQFEDDEYYYYVKAVPKVTLATPERTVKKINSPKKGRPSQGMKSGAKGN